MKKLLLFTLAVTVGLATFAQSPYKNLKVHPSIAGKTAKATKRMVFDQPTQTSSNSTVKAKSQQNQIPQLGDCNDTIIGTTTYDLQTNGSVANRCVYNTNGTVQATWTFSTEYNASWSDRGAGYNFYDGNAWGPEPTVRIEGPTRTGWPEIITLANGKEVVISHAPAASTLMMSTRDPYGSGTWDVNPLSQLTPLQILWPRAASGGPDGNTIHLIAHNEASTVVKGVTGWVSYSRSLDGGLTWDIVTADIPGLDNTNYAFLSADGYAIHSNGNTVAIVYFGALERTILAKSTDNGATWTSQQIFDVPFIYDPNSSNTSGSPLGISDLNGDAVADTLFNSTDGAGTVIVDDAGVVHVFFGFMDYIDDTPGDGSWSYFPGTNGIGYWNDGWGTSVEPQFCAGALDVDGSGTLLDEAANGIEIALYYTSLTTHPNAGIDANGCLYLAYSGIVETLNSGAQFYRHIYAVKSCDGGCTWSYPIDLTNCPDYDFLECVFPSMAHDVGGKFHLIFQRDVEPGLNLQGDMDAVGLNEIYYIKEDATRLDTALYACTGGLKYGNTSFCSGDSVLLTATCGTSWSWSNGATTQSIYAKNFTTYTCDINTTCGYLITDDVTLSSQTTPPSYTVSASTMTACPGDPVTLSTSNVSSATWSWSPGGGATQSVVVTNPGTYIVTVANCGGSTTDSITISGPPAPVVTITASSSTACPGDPITLTTNNVNSATWLWSTNETTQSITVTDTGTYQVTVANCGGSTMESIFIDLPPTPIASITGPMTMCNGDTIQLDATMGSGLTYMWSTGEVTASIMVDTIGTYTVTVTNCAGSDSIFVDITTTPMPNPVITAFGTTTFCQGGSVGLNASGAGIGGSYIWNPGGETTPTLTVTTGGDYTLTGINACGDSVTSAATTVTVNPLPPAPAITCFSPSGSEWGFVCPQCTNGTFQWYLNGNPISGQTGDTLQVEWSTIQNGAVTVKITDSNGCSSTSPNGNCFVGIKEPVFTSLVNVYPNPNNGQFTVNFSNASSDKYTVSVKNILGQMVYNRKLNISGNYRMFIDLSEFNAGMYFLTVANSDGEQTQKIIVK